MIKHWQITDNKSLAHTYYKTKIETLVKVRMGFCDKKNEHKLYLANYRYDAKKKTDAHCPLLSEKHRLKDVLWTAFCSPKSELLIQAKITSLSAIQIVRGLLLVPVLINW